MGEDRGMVTEFRKVVEPITGGGGDGEGADAVVIEKADNGYILRVITVDPQMEDALEEVLVFNDRSELMREVSRRL